LTFVLVDAPMATDYEGSVKSVRWGRNIAYSPPGDLTSRKRLSDASADSGSGSGRPEMVLVGASGISRNLPSSTSTASFDTCDEFS
jgi:hypothetical protein